MNNYDSWKLHNGQTSDDIKEERRLEELAESYALEFDHWLYNTYTEQEIEDLKDLGLI